MIAVGALSALSAVLLSACSSGDSALSTSEGTAGGGVTTQDSAGRSSAPSNGAPANGAPANSAPGASGAPAAKPVTGAPGAPTDASKVSTPGAPVPGVGPRLTRSASLDLQVKDIAAAAARVRSIATGLQAQVLSEQIGKGGPGDPVPLQEERRSSATSNFGGFGTLTLSVPSDKLDSALDQLGRIGTVLRRNASSQDVTSQYVDTESRLKTMQASVDRVRALMARAKDIGQVVALESEMSRRQSDLESLESQLAALKTSVERSTLAVSLSTPSSGNEPVADNGFVAGLGAGWDAFMASASGLFKAVGTVLPFVLFFTLLGAPLWWMWRRTRRHSGLGAQPPASSPAS